MEVPATPRNGRGDGRREPRHLHWQAWAVRPLLDPPKCSRRTMAWPWALHKLKSTRCRLIEDAPPTPHRVSQSNKMTATLAPLALLAFSPPLRPLLPPHAQQPPLPRALCGAHRATMVSMGWASRALIATGASTVAATIAAANARQRRRMADENAQLLERIAAEAERSATLVDAQATLQKTLDEASNQAVILMANAEAAAAARAKAEDAVALEKASRAREVENTRREIQARRRVESKLSEAKTALARGARSLEERMREAAESNEAVRRLAAEAEALSREREEREATYAATEEARAAAEDAACRALDRLAALEATERRASDAEAKLAQAVAETAEVEARLVEVEAKLAEAEARSAEADVRLAEAEAHVAAGAQTIAVAEELKAQLSSKAAEVEAAAVQSWQQAKRAAADEIRTLRFEVESLEKQLAAQMDGQREREKLALTARPHLERVHATLSEQAAAAAARSRAESEARAAADRDATKERDELTQRFTASAALATAAARLDAINWRRASLLTKLADAGQRDAPPLLNAIPALRSWWGEQEASDLQQELQRASQDAAEAYAQYPGLITTAADEASALDAARARLEVELEGRQKGLLSAEERARIDTEAAELEAAASAVAAML